MSARMILEQHRRKRIIKLFINTCLLLQQKCFEKSALCAFDVGAPSVLVSTHKKCVWTSTNKSKVLLHIFVNKSKVSSHQSRYFCVHKLSPLTDGSLNLPTYDKWNYYLDDFGDCTVLVFYLFFCSRESCDFMDPWFYGSHMWKRSHNENWIYDSTLLPCAASQNLKQFLPRKCLGWCLRYHLEEVIQLLALGDTLSRHNL